MMTWWSGRRRRSKFVVYLALLGARPPSRGADASLRNRTPAPAPALIRLSLLMRRNRGASGVLCVVGVGGVILCQGARRGAWRLLNAFATTGACSPVVWALEWPVWLLRPRIWGCGGRAMGRAMERSTGHGWRPRRRAANYPPLQACRSPSKKGPGTGPKQHRTAPRARDRRSGQRDKAVREKAGTSAAVRDEYGPAHC